MLFGTDRTSCNIEKLPVKMKPINISIPSNNSVHILLKTKMSNDLLGFEEEIINGIKINISGCRSSRQETGPLPKKWFIEDLSLVQVTRRNKKI